MGVHLTKSQAIRFNGVTDGIVVPTGQFRESGVDLLGPAYDATNPSPTANTRKSHATKIGRLHLPNQSNSLNAIFNDFTIDAFIIPDSGGVVVEKPGCFILKVGEPWGVGGIVFGVETIDGFYTAQTTYNVNTAVPWSGADQMTSATDTALYSPSDLVLGEQPLMLITAQYTGVELKLFVNGDLVAKLNLGEQRLLKNDSSDLFIGGRGGEFRGVIESVRINRGITAPVVQPLTLQDATIGLWDFNDDIKIPQIHFFDNAFEASPSQSKDGAGLHDGKIDTPFVLIGYDFERGGPSALGSFRIYDPPTNNGTSMGVSDSFKGIELLGAYITGLSPYEVRVRYVESSQVFVIGDSQEYTQTSVGYRSSSTISKSILNAVINQSCTHPVTGLADTPSTKLNGLNVEGATSPLNPIENPVERIRIHSLDFANDKIICSSVFLQSEHSSAANRWDPADRGLLYNHADGTPVWLTLGNGDLVLDDGTTSHHRTVAAANANPRRLDVTNEGINLASGGTEGRPKDAYTRALFTQGQRFEDKSKERNTAYFMATRSRKPTNYLDLVNDTGVLVEGNLASDLSENPDPPVLVSPEGTFAPIAVLDAGAQNYSNGATATVFVDTNPNNNSLDASGAADFKHNFYPKGTWVMEENGAYFNGHDCLKATTEALFMLGNASGNANAFVAADTIGGWSVFAYIRPVWQSGTATVLFAADNGTGTPASTHVTETGSGTYLIDGPGAGSATVSPSATTQSTLLVEISLDPITRNIYIFHRGVLVHTYAGGSAGVSSDLSGFVSLFGSDTAASFNAANPPNTSISGSGSGSVANFRVAEVLIYGLGGANHMARNAVNGYFLNKYGHL